RYQAAPLPGCRLRLPTDKSGVSGRNLSKSNFDLDRLGWAAFFGCSTFCLHVASGGRVKQMR
ncbi:MAG: hypothetical protein VX270_00285, partial [Actinomycetota bacterium]|nr:hypothetical protein [Actinomycetota bacterium]